jgi:hypothetical protein
MPPASTNQNQADGFDVELDDLLDPFGDTAEIVDDDDEDAFIQATHAPERVDGLANLFGSLKCSLNVLKMILDALLTLYRDS